MPYWNSRAKQLSDLDRDLLLTDYANPQLSTAEIERVLELEAGHIQRLKATKNGKRLIAWAESKNPHLENYKFTARGPLPANLTVHAEFSQVVGVLLDEE